MSERTDALFSWYDDWSGLRVAVLGLGMTGFSVADTLCELGARVWVFAGKPEEKYEPLLEVIGATHTVVTPFDHTPAELVEFAPELLIVSPGFHPDHPAILWAHDNNVPVWGDVELAWRVRDKVGRDADRTPAEWIAVTGTNGKTTTVQLTAAMLHAGGLRVAPCGNIGTPVLDAVRDPAGFDVFVVELSSYQLHSTSSMSAWAAVCLNVAEDHLDWHGSMDAYIAAKATVYNHVRSACVYNLADSVTREMVENADVKEGARAIGFGLGSPGPSDFGVVEGIAVDRAFHEDRRNSALEITTLDALAAAGLSAPHTVADVLAASALARSVGVSIEAIRNTLDEFTLDRHRVERVGEANGITWVNDSKATNPHAAEASLAAFASVVWITGGLLKGVDIEPLVASSVARLRAAIIIGTDRSKLRVAFERHAPELPVIEIDSGETEDVMQAVVDVASSLASAGDVVLLAPAAASMDQFTDYADRGTKFAQAVARHIEGSATHDTNPSPETHPEK